MGSSSRARMIRSAAALFGSRGLSATSFSDVLAHSGAPRGSIYHHFPGGKKQLAQDAIGWTSEQVLAHLRACPSSTASGVLAWFIDLWRQSVQASAGSAGCPVAGIAIDTGAAANDLIGAARAAFADWTALLADQLQAAGVPAHRAGPVATATLAAMEGALILCRAERSSQPLETTAQELMNLLPSQAWWSLRRRGQECLRLADEARRIDGTEEAQGIPELVLSLGPPPGPGELLVGAKPREGGRAGCAHRVQRLGCRHEFLVSQLSGGSGPGRIAPGAEPPPRFVATAQ